MLRKWVALLALMAHACGVAASPYIYSPVYARGQIEVRDVNTGRLHDLIQVGGEPFAATLNTTRTRLYILDAQNQQLVIVDTANGATLLTVALTGRPTELMVPHDDSRVVVGFASGGVALTDAFAIIDTSAGAIVHTLQITTTASAISQDGDTLYVIDSSGVPAFCLRHRHSRPRAFPHPSELRWHGPYQGES